MDLVTRWRELAAALLLVALATGRAGAERPLSLHEAVRMALEKNESVVIAHESVVAAAAGVRGAQGVYDPVLVLNGAWSRSLEPLNVGFPGVSRPQIAPEVETAEAGGEIRQRLQTGGALVVHAKGLRQTSDNLSALLSPAYGTRVGVELRQPLWRDLTMDDSRLAVRRARSGRDAAVAGLRRDVSETVAAVERAYWVLVATRQGVEVREDAVRLAEQQLGETESRISTGSAPGTELSEPRAELERRRSELLAERERQAQAQNALKLVILPDADLARWLEPIAPTDTVDVVAEPVERTGALERALAGRPEMDVVRAALEQRRAETARAKSAQWPALDAVVSYDRFGLAGSSNPAGPGGTLPAGLDGDLGRSIRMLSDRGSDATRVALELGLPITNRTARAAVVAAHSAERQAEAVLAQARKVICAEVLDAAAALESAGQRVAATRAGRDAAEVQFTAERERFAAGQSTNFLVLTRQNQLSRARLDEIAARTDYEAARTELARATGSLIEAHGIEVPSPTR